MLTTSVTTVVANGPLPSAHVRAGFRMATRVMADEQLHGATTVTRDRTRPLLTKFAPRNATDGVVGPLEKSS